MPVQTNPADSLKKIGKLKETPLTEVMKRNDRSIRVIGWATVLANKSANKGQKLSADTKTLSDENTERKGRNSKEYTSRGLMKDVESQLRGSENMMRADNKRDSTKDGSPQNNHGADTQNRHKRKTTNEIANDYEDTFSRVTITGRTIQTPNEQSMPSCIVGIQMARPMKAIHKRSEDEMRQ